MSIQIKPWPKDDSVVDFEELTAPVVNAIEFLYTLTRRNDGRDIPYVGYDRPSLMATTFSIPETLDVNYLEAVLRDQGRSPLDVLVCSGGPVGDRARTEDRESGGAEAAGDGYSALEVQCVNRISMDLSMTTPENDI